MPKLAVADRLATFHSLNRHKNHTFVIGKGPPAVKERYVGHRRCPLYDTVQPY